MVFVRCRVWFGRFEFYVLFVVLLYLGSCGLIDFVGDVNLIGGDV